MTADAAPWVCLRDRGHTGLCTFGRAPGDAADWQQDPHIAAELQRQEAEAMAQLWDGVMASFRRPPP